MALAHDPVLRYPLSSVTTPVLARRSPMSIPSSPAVPWITGSSVLLPAMVMVAASLAVSVSFVIRSVP